MNTAPHGDRSNQHTHTKWREGCVSGIKIAPSLNETQKTDVWSNIRRSSNTIQDSQNLFARSTAPAKKKTEASEALQLPHKMISIISMYSKHCPSLANMTPPTKQHLQHFDMWSRTFTVATFGGGEENLHRTWSRSDWRNCCWTSRWPFLHRTPCTFWQKCVGISRRSPQWDRLHGQRIRLVRRWAMMRTFLQSLDVFLFLVTRSVL